MTNHIKIYGVKPRIQYVANGNLKKYEFPFAIFKTSDVDVYLDDKLLTTSEYEVSVEPDIEGGSISFKVAPANGKVITIARNLSIERTTDFQEGCALRANVLNDELDYQIACQQQIADSLNRSMVLPPYAVDTDVDLTLPSPSAGKAIVWNADGTNLENSTIKVNELESTLNGYKTEAQNAATTAINKADIATAQAQTATTQAGIATAKAEVASQKATEVSNALSVKANKDMDNLTAIGKENIVNLVMPGYFARSRDNLISGVWNYANKDVLVTVNLTTNLQGGIFISPDGGVTAAQAIRCVAPSSGGYSGCSAFIRKGLYYQAISNHEAYVDYLMGE